MDRRDPARHNSGMRLGVAHHFGWAVAVSASDSHEVVDRRRLELIEPDLPVAPIHHAGGVHEIHRWGEQLDDAQLSELVTEVRTAVRRATARGLDELTDVVGGPFDSISLRTWPADFPTDIATLRVPPYESRADSVMYVQVLAELARERGWRVHHYDLATSERLASAILGPRAREVLHGPRATLGPPWNQEHRAALAATVLAATASTA
jgi:hypothetical protein